MTNAAAVLQNGLAMTVIDTLWKSAAALVALAALSACTSSSSGLKPLEDKTEIKQESYATTYKGPRSPASAYCVQMGGALIDTPKGKNTLCRWPDGKEMDPWDLFWRDNPLN